MSFAYTKKCDQYVKVHTHKKVYILLLKKFLQLLQKQQTDKIVYMQSEVKEMAYHFNNRIEILGMESMINDEGGFEEIETTIFKPWADIKTMRASEFEAMGFTVTNVPIRFIIRYRKGIELDHKIKYNGDMYKIESIENDDGKNHTLTIFANRNEM